MTTLLKKYNALLQGALADMENCNIDMACCNSEAYKIYLEIVRDLEKECNINKD